MPLEVRLFAAAYGLAAFGFLLLAGLLVVRPIRSHIGRIFLGATLISCITYGLTLLTIWFPSLSELRPIASLPMVAWGGFLLFCLRQVTDKRIARLLSVALVVFWVIDVFLQLRLMPVANELRFTTRIGLAILVVICAEQLIRNSDTTLRWATKHVVLAVVICAGFDVVFYAYGLVLGGLEPSLAVLRGFVWAVACPLLAVSAARNPSWDVGIHVSRTVVFHSLTVIVVGVFMLVLGALGYLATQMGFAWGTIFQGVFVVGGFALGATALISQTFRSRIRAFIDKNFYSYRFDYRDEWLRFTAALSGKDEGSVFRTVGQSFELLMDAPGSVLYLRRNSNFEVQYQFGVSKAKNIIGGAETALPSQPIDLNTAAANVRNLFVDDAAAVATMGAPPRFVIPLGADDARLGYVVLPTTRSGLTLDREVSDVLTVAARHAATFIQQAITTEDLVVARQFDSFNKMSAFVVHDLKNLAAQLALLTANAEQHKDNPEFQKDMIETVQHVTQRMRALLEQLSKGTTSVDPPAVVDVYACTEHAIRSKPSIRTKPIVQRNAAAPANTLAHEDRLSRIIGHLVQNADEATAGKDGRIDIVVTDSDARAIHIEVSDNGCGMSDSFIRERLFRPFVSTKETGMGIGVFESANYLKDIGGALRVVSRLNVGTTFTIQLPRAQLT